MSTQFQMVEMDASKAAIWSGVKVPHTPHSYTFNPKAQAGLQRLLKLLPKAQTLNP